MKKVFIYIMILLLIFSFVKFNARADNCLNKVGALPYEITAIFSSGDNIFVGTKQGFFVSKNSGKTFLERDKGLSDLEITSVVFLKGTLFLGTANSGLYISHDLGNTWISLMDKLNCPTVSSLSTDGRNIFVTSLCSGFHFSDDLGVTWKERNGGLPTLRSTIFLETPQGRCFLGTDQYGMFYSDTLGKTCVWDKFFEKYTITSLSFIGNTLLIGTNSGIFAGGILRDDFKKLDFIGGNPYILAMIRVNNSVIVAVRGFGLFATNDGKSFVRVNCGDFVDVSALFYSDIANKLYIGTSSGNLYYINLSKPFIVTQDSLNLGSVSQGNKLNGNIHIVNLGANDLKISVKSPYFIHFKQNKFVNSDDLKFIIDTSTLSVGKYTEEIVITSNSSTVNIYVHFTVEPPSSIVVKLTIGSSSAYVNNKKVKLDMSPFIDPHSNRTLVPVRFISEAFGARVEWDPVEREVSIKKEPTEHHGPVLIELWIGEKKVLVNLKATSIDVAPKIIPPGRTVVPLRFIAETFGAKVLWNAKTREIAITYLP